MCGGQLSLPHEMNTKLKCETEYKLMSVIGLVQSHYHEFSPESKKDLSLFFYFLDCEGFVEKVGFEPGMKE